MRLEECDRSPGAETGRDQPGFGGGGWGDNRVPQTLSNLRENDFGFLAAIGSLLRQFSTVSRRRSSSGETQPDTPNWNPSGFMRNVIEQTSVVVG